MAPKVLLVLGVLMAALLFISSEVTAREMTETTAKEAQTKGAVDVEEQSGGPCARCGYGCCGGFDKRGCCRRCCPPPSEAAEGAEDAVTDQYGGRCRYRCCGGWYHGRCRRCCAHKDEAPEVVETEAEPHN